MDYAITYSVQERRNGETLSGAAETWTLQELVDMGLDRLVECALDRMDGQATTPLSMMCVGGSEITVTAHRSLPLLPREAVCNYFHETSEHKPATMQYLSVGRGTQYLCGECVQDVMEGGGILSIFLEPVSK